MNPKRDIASSFRAVSQLRRLCLSLPHVPPPAERRLLARFEDLVTSPESATKTDVDALAAGWRAWWRASRVSDLAAMSSKVPTGVIDSDRRLTTYAVAAEASQARAPACVLTSTRA